MKKLKDILCWLGLFAGLIGLFYVLGACGGIERGMDMSDEAWRVLVGLGMIGLGAWSVKTALD